MKHPIEQTTPITTPSQPSTQPISRSPVKQNVTENLSRKLSSWTWPGNGTQPNPITQPMATLMHPLSELLRIADQPMADEEAELMLASLSTFSRDVRNAHRTPGTNILPTFESISQSTTQAISQSLNASPFKNKIGPAGSFRSAESNITASYVNERNAQLIESNDQLKQALINEQRDHRSIVESLKQQINQSAIDHQQSINQLNQTKDQTINQLREDINQLTNQINQLQSNEQEYRMIVEDKHSVIQLLREEIAALKERENQFLNDHEAAFEALTSMVRDKEQRLIDTLKHHETSMNQRREFVIQMKSSLIAGLAQQAERVRTLQSSYDAAVAAHIHCETDRSALEAQLKGLTDDLHARQRDYDRLAQQSAQYQKTSQTNEAKLRALVERLEDEVNDRESILQMTEHRMSERHKAVLQSVEESRTAAERQCKQMRARLIEMEAELESRVQQYADLQASSERRGEIQSLKLQLDDLNHALMSKDSELAVVRASQRQLEVRLNEVSQSAQRHGQSIKLAGPSDMDPVTLILMWFLFLQIACAILYVFSDSLPSWSDIERQLYGSTY